MMLPAFVEAAFEMADYLLRVQGGFWQPGNRVDVGGIKKTLLSWGPHWTMLQGHRRELYQAGFHFCFLDPSKQSRIIDEALKHPCGHDNGPAAATVHQVAIEIRPTGDRFGQPGRDVGDQRVP